jgi:hypothetical protein
MIEGIGLDIVQGDCFVAVLLAMTWGKGPRNDMGKEPSPYFTLYCLYDIIII